MPCSVAIKVLPRTHPKPATYALNLCGSCKKAVCGTFSSKLIFLMSRLSGVLGDEFNLHWARRLFFWLHRVLVGLQQAKANFSR